MCETHYPGVAQLVGRLVWDQDAASSSLATRTKNAGMAKCHPCIFLLNARLKRSNATVRWTVACRRLDGGNTSIFFPPGRKCKRVSPLR